MESSLTISEGTQFIFSSSFFSMLEVILTQSPCHADTVLSSVLGKGDKCFWCSVCPCQSWLLKTQNNFSFGTKHGLCEISDVKRAIAI